MSFICVHERDKRTPTQSTRCNTTICWCSSSSSTNGGSKFHDTYRLIDRVSQSLLLLVASSSTAIPKVKSVYYTSNLVLLPPLVSFIAHTSFALVMHISCPKQNLVLSPFISYISPKCFLHCSYRYHMHVHACIYIHDQVA